MSRPDLLRSVFLSGAAGGAAPESPRADEHAPGTGGPALTVRDLGVSFGGIRAVDGVTFEIAEREIVGVIGPNGAGKTTVFDLISGFTPADSGHVELGGVDVSSAGPSVRFSRGLGRSFQDARLFPDLTVRETLAVALERWVGSKNPLAAAFHLPME